MAASIVAENLPERIGMIAGKPAVHLGDQVIPVDEQIEGDDRA